MPTAAPSRKSALLCPRCRKLVSADVNRCPHCGLANPGSRWAAVAMGGGLFQERPLINTITGVCIAMYLLSLLVSRHGLNLSLNPLTALSPDYEGLILMGATGTIPIDRFGRWWSILSATYLHGGVLHIVFNMLAFRQIAVLVIREYGAHRMLTVYTLSSCGGFLISYLAGIHLTIGASAAVCGLIGAALYYGKSRGGVYGQAIYRQVGGWAVGIALFGLIVPGINNWAHGGGLAAGVVVGFLMGYHEKRHETPIHRFMGWLCVCGTGAILLWAAVTGVWQRLA
jgi:rhomboid protease GluP